MDFTSEEKELLIAAEKSKGEFHLISTAKIGDWIRVGGKDFPENPENSDPAIVAKYREAFDSLCNRGYIRHIGSILYKLTNSGFDIARKLAEEE